MLSEPLNQTRDVIWWPRNTPSKTRTVCPYAHALYARPKARMPCWGSDL